MNESNLITTMKSEVLQTEVLADRDLSELINYFLSDPEMDIEKELDSEMKNKLNSESKSYDK